MLKITAEEVNFLVHQYLEETGYKHTAFTFRHESNIDKSPLNEAHIPPSMLLMYLEKALLMLQMETHLDKDDEVILCNQPFTLLSPHVCGYSRTTIDRSHDEPAKRTLPVQIPMQVPMHGSTLSEPLPKVTIAIPPSVQPQPVHASVPQPQSSMPIQTAPVTLPQGTAQPDRMQIDTPKLVKDEPKVPKDPPAPPKESGGMEEEKHAAKPVKPIVPAITARGVKVLEGHQGMVYNVAWHPNKRILASGGGDSTARLWQVPPDSIEKREGSVVSSYVDPKKSPQLQVLPHINPESRIAQIDVTALNWSAKKGLLVTGASDGVARVWNENGNFFGCGFFKKREKRSPSSSNRRRGDSTKSR